MEAALPVFTAAGSLFRPQTVGMYLQRANSKLCFLLHKKFFAAENSLLARGGEKAPPKSALFDRRLRHERIVIFSNRRGKSLTSKISIMEKNRPTRKGRGGGRPAKVGAAVEGCFYQGTGLRRRVPSDKNRPRNIGIRGQTDAIARSISGDRSQL